MSACPASTSDQRYDPVTVWLHWITVALVVALWSLGMTADSFPRGAPRGTAWSIHVVLGFAVAFVLVTRIAWRAQYGRVLPPADTGVLHVIAKATHYTLYVLLAIVTALGIANASYRGFNVFDVWHVPRFGAGDAATRRAINGWHELAANLMMVVALLHATAALIHHYVWRDRLLDRMKL
jgi:cytochrome b561